jgi:tetratricopeptide (TPR) repeat protein
MAFVLSRQDKLDEAETFAERAVEIFEKPRKRDLLVATAYVNLGHIRRRQGRLKPAEALLEEAYAIQKKMLSRSHPHLAGTLHELAKLFMAQQRWQEAEDACRRDVQLCEEYLVDIHPSLARALENYADLLERQVRDVEAGSLRERARQIRACFEAKKPAATDSLVDLDTAIRPPPA